MVKCPICDGRGKYANAFGVVGTCHYCKGSGYLVERGRKNMTEQEWLQTCNTEQLAEELFQLCITVLNHGGEFELKEEEIAFIKLKIKSWLKQPHTTEGVGK